MTDDRTNVEKLIETTGGPRILMALLQSGPNYIHGIHYDIRLSSATIKRTIPLLLELKLVKQVPAPRTVIHAEEFYELTAIGQEVAVLIRKCYDGVTQIIASHGKSARYSD